jgi:octopine/nopaline transport system substrate-binding protein
MKAFITGFVAILLAIAVPASAQTLAAGTKVRIATEGAYKPWNFRDSKGKLAGFEIDLVRMLCADLAVQCDITTENWARMLPQLNAGAFDAVFAGMSITKIRKQQARFSTPYATTPAVFVTRTGSRTPNTRATDLVLPVVTNLDDEALLAIREAFLNAEIGVQAGTTHEQFLREYIDGYGLIRAYGDQKSLDADLVGGKLGAMLVSLGYAAPLIRSKAGDNLQISVPQLSGGPFGEGIGAAFRQDSAALEEAFSGAIKKRIADGSVRDLSIKWFELDVSAKR